MPFLQNDFLMLMFIVFGEWAKNIILMNFIVLPWFYHSAPCFKCFFRSLKI